jgi:hypothetical protein
MTRLTTTLVLAVLMLAGCGGEDERPAPAATPEPTATPAGSFPDRPQLADDFSDPGSGWAASGYDAGAYRLPAGADAVSAFAPVRVDPSNRGTLAEVAVEAPRGGAAGLGCRMSADRRTGYVLLLYGRSRIQLVRLEDGHAETLKAHALTPNERSDPGEPTLLRLGCGTGEPGTPMTLSYTVNATPYGFVGDRESVDPGGSARAGVVARGGIARFDEFALWLGT